MKGRHECYICNNKFCDRTEHREVLDYCYFDTNGLSLTEAGKRKFGEKYLELTVQKNNKTKYAINTSR